MFFSVADLVSILFFLGGIGVLSGVFGLVVQLVQKRRWRPPLALILISLVLYAVGFFISPNMKEAANTLLNGTILPTPTFQQEFTLANRVTYEDILYGNNDYIGQSVQLRGWVVEVHDEDGDSDWLQVAVPQGTTGIWEGYLRLDYDGEALATGDVIDLVGNVEGLWNYTLSSGDKMIMPHISGGRAKVVGEDN